MKLVADFIIRLAFCLAFGAIFHLELTLTSLAIYILVTIVMMAGQKR